MKKLYFLAAVATMFAACNSEELAPVVDEMTNTPIALHAGVAELVTRAGYPTGPLAVPGSSLGFYMETVGETNTTGSRYFADNMKFTYGDATGWTPEGNSPLWKNATSTVKYYAYYPYSEWGTNQRIEIEVPTEQTNDDVVDFLFANGTTTGADSEDGIDLAFNHMMTKLKIKLTAKSEFATTPEFAKVTIKGLKNKRWFLLNTEIDLKNGEDGWDDFSDNVNPADVTMIKNSDNEFEAIVIPQTVTEFAVEIIADNRTFRYTQENVTLSAGTSYELNLEVGKDKANIKSATVKEWTSDKTTLTGENGTDEIIEEPKYELKDNTYFVENGAGLQEVARQIGSNSSANITLVNDIYLPKPAEGASNWTKIGDYYGIFDGNGKKITGMTIVGTNWSGFIQNLHQNAQVKNVTFVSATVTATSTYNGIIVAKNHGGIISGCTVVNSTLTSGGRSGAIVSSNSATENTTDGGTIIGCKVIGCTFSTENGGYVGSIAGVNEKSAQIIGCLASGVSGANGGLVGNNSSDQGLSAIIGCYAYQCGNLNGNANIAGGNSATITTCYYTPSTDGTLTAYDGTAATDWAAAVSAMNNAIDGATLPAGADKFHWGGTQSEPTLTKQ